MTALIIGGGVLINPEKIREKLAGNEFELIIACDSGYDNALKLSIKPQMVVGDFDSIKNTVSDAEIVVLPAEKDDTDLRVAINLALEKKCEKVTILCATGGRLDHFYGNVSSLEYLEKHGVDAEIIDEQNVISLSKKGKITYKNISKYVSVIPICEKIILSTENLKYEVENMEIFRDNIISISNESLKETFSLEIDGGKAYIIQSD